MKDDCFHSKVYKKKYLQLHLKQPEVWNLNNHNGK